MKNNKGLSGVITTLIIILLVIAAIGIIWAVVKPILSDSGSDIEMGNKCLNAGVEVVLASCDSTGDNCTVTLKRTAGGEDELAGVKVIFHNSDKTVNYIADYEGDISALGTNSLSSLNAYSNMSATPATVSIAPYYEQTSGDDYLCPEEGEHTVNLA